MRLSVVGTGHVGLVAGACLAQMGNQVLCADKDEAKIASLSRGVPPFFEPGLEDMVRQNLAQDRLAFTTSIKEAVQGSQVIFIAVDTPPRPDGSADLSALLNVTHQIAHNLNGYKVVVQKSTVPVGTGERIERTLRESVNGAGELELVSMPEFMREGTAIQDFLHPDRIVLGVKSSRAREIMEGILKPLDAPMVVADIPTAEMIKYASNAFLTMKISYINAVANICEQVGADVTKVAEGMGADPRIGHRFLAAGVGYGGACFHKDVSAFIKMAEDLGYDFQMLRDVQEINYNQRVRLVEKVRRALGTLQGKQVGVLGLAYKPNTDDMRNAPSIDVIDLLLKGGARVKACDPAALDTARGLLGDAITLCASPYQVAEGSDALALVTEWEEFRNMDLERLKGLMSRPVLVDGRNLFQPQRMADMGWEYYGMGRQTINPNLSIRENREISPGYPASA
ncbi:MAG: UDP-glucose/GDP-mannose dehydrogenase family protein [Chloroflexi bacterium]|nr:UDP-glucose/GDP-mannose dehydrogenase family protein [Chloroflexota bacterium]